MNESAKLIAAIIARSMDYLKSPSPENEEAIAKALEEMRLSEEVHSK